MPRKTVTIDLSQLEKRAEYAARVRKLLAGLYDASMKQIPSYTGKSRFTDRIRKIEDIAHMLHVDLAGDVREAKKLA